ncbi:hypothetical protein V1264_017410 [Littorina saxatilis]|uniref:Uncharacterized protein n=1 Tax=Littorina saxatilis TaxID=31220 RepID=A0AAN9BIH8_9CAEN
MSTVDESLAKLGQSKIFTKLDAKSGFWQIPLCQESKLLTTFITPFGRYCFNRLPFGISSAPEIFQRIMSEILLDLDGVICHMDDILIHAADQAIHDQRVRAVLTRLQEAGLTLNEKCEFSKTSIKFLGHIIDANGIHADPKKIEAVKNFPAPTTVTELQRFMGMVNQLAKFIPSLAETNAPLRHLLHKDAVWVWDQPQQTAFQKVKDLLISRAVLAHYDPRRETIIAADASATGIGAVLLQIQHDGSRRPVCFISRSLSDAEKNYAVIEKEALAATWACERFNDYVMGLNFTLETDHKPLVPLFGTKELHKMPPRIQRFRLRLMRYNPKVVHVSGKDQITADALSRAPVADPDDSDLDLIENVAALASQTVSILPATTRKLQEIRDSQKADEELHQVREYCTIGWPVYMPENPLFKQYWLNREHLTIIDDLLLFDDRLVIPRCLRLDILGRLHEGHLGITKCQALARTSVWWPYIASEVEEMVNKCTTCAIHRPEKKEPLLPSSFPERPWERVGMDFLTLHGKVYLSIVDYYSRWVETKLLKSESSAETINQIKSVFAVHGIPDVVVSDNGPQFSSNEFTSFAASYGFTHVTSSPKYPQSNGEAERAVQTVKLLLKKNKDPYLALLMYRSTPLQNGLSPSQLLMGRKLKTLVPVLPNTLKPQTPDHDSVKAKETASKEKQRQTFDRRHAAKDLPSLQPGDSVWVRDMKRSGEVVAKATSPRSYIIRTEKGTIRRNRSAMVSTPADGNNQLSTPKASQTPQQPTPDAQPTSPAVLRSSLPQPSLTPNPGSAPCTRSGRPVVKPNRLDL